MSHVQRWLVAPGSGYDQCWLVSEALIVARSSVFLCVMERRVATFTDKLALPTMQCISNIKFVAICIATSASNNANGNKRVIFFSV